MQRVWVAPEGFFSGAGDEILKSRIRLVGKRMSVCHLPRLQPAP